MAFGDEGECGVAEKEDGEEIYRGDKEKLYPEFPGAEGFAPDAFDDGAALVAGERGELGEEADSVAEHLGLLYRSGWGVGPYFPGVKAKCAGFELPAFRSGC